VGVLLWQARNGHTVASWIGDMPRALHLDALLPSSLPHLDGGLWLMFSVLATIALVSGVAVYMASEKQ
jgi:ABC-type cobalamin transport system ATPase subunit